jgi:excisionase family DNA binding protein
MSNTNLHKLARHEREQAKEAIVPNGRPDEGSQRPTLLACLLLVPSDAEPIVTLLEQLATSSHAPFPSLLDPAPHVSAAMEDRWLEHTEAAEYLGVARSTLYRYVGHRRIEFRKIAGRLEYRQSTLEKLKEDQIRPARPPLRAQGIIPVALSSGK